MMILAKSKYLKLEIFFEKSHLCVLAAEVFFPASYQTFFCEMNQTEIFITLTIEIDTLYGIGIERDFQLIERS